MAEEIQAQITARFTNSFENNLTQIEAYWDNNQFPAGYDRLIEELIETTLPTLEQHPRLGRQFLDRSPQTEQAKKKMQSLSKQLIATATNAELREYVMTDYTVLYTLIAENIYLLAIKHHKQLGFQL